MYTGCFLSCCIWLSIVDNTDGQYSGDSGLLEYSTASLDRKNKRKGSLESLRVGNATAQGIKTEEVQNHQRKLVYLSSMCICFASCLSAGCICNVALY